MRGAPVPPPPAGALRPAAAGDGWRFRPWPRHGERLRGGGGGRPVRRPAGAVLCGGGVFLALRAAGRPGPGGLPAAGRGRWRGQHRGRRRGEAAGRRERGALRAAPGVPACRRRGDGLRRHPERGPEHGGVRRRGVLRDRPGREPGRRPAPGLLSIGEKQRVLISKITVEVKTVSAKLATDVPSLGSSIDLDRVQTIMESMGSKLSPGAQQLMDMVRCQQKNSLPLGDKLNWIFGKNSDFGGDRAIDGLGSAAIQASLDQSASEALPVKNHLTSETVCEDLISRDLNTQVPERGNTSDSERLTTQQNRVDLRNYFKVMGSLHMQEEVSETPSVANPQVLLPFLQNLCSQVNHLRLKDGDKHFGKNAVTKEEGVQCVGVEQQPICSYLEKMISKNMDLMEKKLMDYIDRQIQALQTHIDNKMVLLMDLVQNSKPNKISQAHYGSNEGLSNGER
ncbi:ATPase PAAT isoform X1 [Mycteria americana]|uniref:ATPase PAAT isoform X1 n=1 Tax=Mycteria americana TaxID=33587 RepID=UPI003F58A0B7